MNNISSHKSEYPKLNELSSALKLVQSFGIMNSSSVEDIMKKQINDILSKQHQYSIYQGKDGRWATYVKDEHKKTGRRKIVKPTREELDRALYDYYSGQNEEAAKRNITLESLFPEWVEDKKGEVDIQTIERYHSDWKRFYQDTDLVKIPLVELDRLTIKKWIKNTVIENSLTRKQYINMAVIINQTLDFAVENKIIPSNPYLTITLKREKYFTHEKKKTKEQEVFIGDERKLLEHYAMEEFHSGVKKYAFAPLAVIFLKRTGLRIGEICALRYEDIENKSIWIRRFYNKNKNTIKENPKGTFGDRNIPLDHKAQEILSIIAEERKKNNIPLEGYIFTTNGKPLSYRAVADSLKKYCKQMQTINKSPHKLRKTCLTDWHNAGISDYTIQQWAGHKDISTANKSYFRDTTSEDALLDKLNQIP